MKGYQFVTVILILASSLTAWAQDAPPRPRKTTQDPKWLGLRENLEQMHAAMNSIKSSGDSDVDFVKLMLPHHQAAINMAKTQLVYGSDPQMRRLAQEIITDQQSEIEVMQLWLKQHLPSAQKTDQTPALHASKENTK